MRYRDARLLKEGDTVVAKENEQTYYVSTIEVYGNVKTVRVNCQEKVSWLHTELKDHDA
jgi:hypothetical protein